MFCEDDDATAIDTATAVGMLHGAPWRRFVVIGDSLSAGTGDSRTGYLPGGWPLRVAEVLRRVNHDSTYLNLAVDGATTVQCLETQAPRLEELEPDLLHIPSGPNDLLAAAPDFGRIEADLDRLFATAVATGALVTAFTLGRVFQVPAFADWSERIRRLNSIVRRLAAGYDVVLVDMWEHPVYERDDLLSEDRIHFAAPGQAAMAAEIVRALSARLAMTRETPR